jgi:rod shape determining protein RodA
VGSGEIWGKGFLKGTQSQLDFIPEKYTDFVFSVYCEEWGFVGALVLLVLYFLLFVRLAIITAEARESFGMILGYGLTSLFLWHFIINLGMVLGLLPIVGIPLPLFSYGGSSLVITMFSLGVLINIHIKRYIF